MPIAPLMQRFVDDELAGSAAWIARVVAGTLQLLRDPREGDIGSAERARHVELAIALQQRADDYQRAFVAALTQRVGEELGGRSGITADGVAADGIASDKSLELMDETRVEVDIEISRALQLIDTTAEWELRELQTFTSTLVGQSHVSADSNPLRPLVYASALWHAACAVIEPQAQRAMLLRLSAGVAAGLLKKAWAAACTRLETLGVVPGNYRTVLLPPGAVGARPSAIDPTRPAALGALLARMPGAAPVVQPSPGAVRAQGPADQRRAVAASTAEPESALLDTATEFEQVLRRLDEWLRQLPPEAPKAGAAASIRHLGDHRAALVASAGSGSERQTIELLARLYEALLGDPQLPPAFRAVIARMQVSTLRVALNDQATLASCDHQVWRLMDRISAASAAYPEPGDARLDALLAFCQAIAEDIARAATPDAALYRRSLNRLDRFLAEQLQAQLGEAQAAVDALQLAERRDALEQQLSQRLTEQIASLHTTPCIRRFVTGAWAKVLADVIARSGEQSDETRNYLKSTDDLLWSLTLPDHPQNRQRLLALLPTLLQRLHSGMERIALPAAAQQALLNELMAIHTEALRPGRSASSPLTPEQIVQRMRDEVLPETPGLRPFSDSVIDLPSMDTVPAELLPSGEADGDDDASRRVDALRVAERMRIFLLGRWMPVQLLWRSERGLFFLLAGDAAGRTHSITRRALERLSGAGLIRPLETRPLLQRAIESLLHELARTA